jgi:hypothetical protein
MARKPEPEAPLEIDGVPTAAGLAKRGREFAYQVGGIYHITDAGNAVLSEALRRQGRERRGKWHGISGVHDSEPRQPGL